MDTNNQLKYDQIIEALGGVSEVTQAAATAAEAAATAAAVIVGVANQSVSTVVSSYADIPLATTPNAALYLVLESSGGLFGNQFPAGFYRQVGNPPVWTFIGPNSNGLMANVVVTNFPTEALAKIEDTAGNPLTSTFGSLNVNITNSTPGAATADNQASEITALTVIASNTLNTVSASTAAASLLLAAQTATTDAITEAASLLLAAQTVTATNQHISGTVAISNFPLPITSTTATVLAETVTTTPTLLLGTNLNRKGLAIQNTNQITFIKLDSTVSTALYSYELPKKGILEIENYCGPVTAVTASGSTIVMVTEKV